MPSLFSLSYGVTLDCLLTWFPSKPGSNLSGPRLHGATFRRLSDEAGLSVRVPHLVKLAGIFGPFGSVDVGVENGLFKAEVRLELFGAVRQAKLTIPPNAQVPFMLYVEQGNDGFENEGTAGVFQGVFASDRGPFFTLGLANLIDLLKREP
ncbi:MAG TPA: hypothetical protein VGL19_03625 [Polyangiaceae bacterium]